MGEAKEVKKTEEVTEEKLKKQPKKLSYDELAKVASELQQQGQMLYQENQQLKNQGLLIRIEFLFKILEHKDLFPLEYVTSVSEEIMEAMHPNQPPENANMKSAE